MRVLLVTALLLAACKSVPADPYARAGQAVDAGRLFEALELLDKVPPAHPSYPEARTMAQAVERRMRAGQEMLLRGLLMRTEWRDEEAIRHFEWAREVWPKIEGAEDLIRATRNRMTSLAQVAAAETPEPGRAASTLPVEDGGGYEEFISSPARPDHDSMPSVEVVGPADESVVAQLHAVESLLAKGELQEALARLEDLHLLHPDAMSIRRTLARVLHQRALVRYGQGFLEAAIADWARVDQLDKGIAQVPQFLQAARAQLAARKGS